VGALTGYVPDMATVRQDVAALAATSRSSARPGEARSAAWLTRRLRERGVAEVSAQTYRYQHSYALAHAAHHLAGVLACALGGRPGAVLGAAALASFEREASGRSQWLRRVLPAGEGRNAVGRIPASGRVRGRLVLVAHHDAANTGLIWHPRIVAAGGRRHLRRRRVDPFMAPAEAAFVLGIGGSLLAPGSRAGRRLRALAGALLSVGIVVDADIGRGATVPGACDNATGVAVALDLARALAARPPREVEVVIALVGGEEAGMGGMRAFLDAHQGPLAGAPALVLGLDTLGAGTPIVCSGEGAMREQRYPERELGLVAEGAALAGLPAPPRWRIGGWTDPVLAVHRRLPAASILSMGPGYFPHYHHPTDTPERIDWDSVAACARLAAGCVTAFERRAAGA